MKFLIAKLSIFTLFASISFTAAAQAQQKVDDKFLPTEKHAKKENAKKVHKEIYNK